MRGEVPSARKPWGAPKAKKRGGGNGLPRRTFTFKAKQPIGLHVNSKTMQVYICIYFALFFSFLFLFFFKQNCFQNMSSMNDLVNMLPVFILKLNSSSV